MSRYHRAFLVVVIGLFVGISAYATDKTTVDDYDAVFDLREWNCEVSGNKVELKEHLRLTVKNRRGDDYGRIYFYENHFSKLKDVKITVLDKFGKVLNRYGKKDLRKSCGYGASYVLYDDACTYSVNASVATFPYTVDIEYTEEYGSLFFLPGPTLVSDIPTVSGKFTLVFSSPIVMHFKEYGTNIPRIEESRGDRNVWRWEVENLLPPKPAGLSQLDFGRAGEVELCADAFDLEGYKLSGLNWQNVGRWYGELAANRYDREGWPDDGQYRSDSLAEIIQQGYDNVRKTNRYVAVSIGIGGWQPHDAQKTRQYRFGDCKDLTTLLISDLRKRKVHAQPVLVLTRDEGIVDTAFPNHDFNHVITAVPADADTFWMDPTCSNCPFGDLPGDDEDINVLLVDETGGHIVRTPASRSEDNRVFRTARVTIDHNRNLAIDGSIAYTGNYAHSRWTTLTSMKQDELAAYVHNRLGDVRTPVVVKSVTVDNSSNTDSITTIHFEAYSKKPLSLLQSTLYVRSSPFEQGTRYNEQDVKDRKRPLNLGFPREIIDSVTIMWDSSLAVDSIVAPDDADLVEAACRMTSHSDINGNTFTVVVHDVHSAYGIPPDQFDTFLKFESNGAQIDKQCARLILRRP